MTALILVAWAFGMVAAARPDNPYAWHQCPRDCDSYACPWLDDDEYDRRVDALALYAEGSRHDSMWG